MYRLGVIPAAGKATRWGDGTLKELLPIDGPKRLIDHSVEALGKVCNSVLVVTNDDKMATLSRRHYGPHAPPMAFTHQIGRQDMWSAMRTSLSFYADQYFFAMPDTLYPVDTFLHAPARDCHFAMGMFYTESPWRFGMLRGVPRDHIVNKEGETGGGLAWGTLMWDRQCAFEWLSKGLTNYTDAINYAIERHGLQTWEMDHYFDFANRAEYDRYWATTKEGGFPSP